MLAGQVGAGGGPGVLEQRPQSGEGADHVLGYREDLYTRVKAAFESSLGEGTIVLCHVSHVYVTRCSLYFTVAARGGADSLARWLEAKRAASDAMIAAGATITHHATGTDHKPGFAQEIGPVGVRVLRAVKAELDPTGVLNPGVVIPQPTCAEHEHPASSAACDSGRALHAGVDHSGPDRRRRRPRGTRRAP